MVLALFEVLLPVILILWFWQIVNALREGRRRRKIWHTGTPGFGVTLLLIGLLVMAGGLWLSLGQEWPWIQAAAVLALGVASFEIIHGVRIMRASMSAWHGAQRVGFGLLWLLMGGALALTDRLPQQMPGWGWIIAVIVSLVLLGLATFLRSEVENENEQQVPRSS